MVQLATELAVAGVADSEPRRNRAMLGHDGSLDPRRLLH
jgi:hypothetical protein